jgi:hypothetical protein
MESIHKEGQQTLSLKSEQQRRKVEEELKQRSERFKKAKQDLEERMDSEEFKRMRWVKLARKKGIPYFEEPSSPKAFPIPSIKSTPVWMTGHPTNERREEEGKIRGSFGSRRKDSFQWDLISREVDQARTRVWRAISTREKGP